MSALKRSAAALCMLGLLGACATPAPPLDGPAQARLEALLPADVLLLGEQHDAPEHQQLQRQVVTWLAGRGQLAALALEMAEQGRSTAGLPPQASQEQVRQALAWREAGWPWARYGPQVMAAVRAGVPVLGANLPRARMREAMGDETLDARLPGPALAAQRQRIREGHCHLLPEAQVAPMTRIQMARDMAMAHTVQAARAPGRTVLLIAGNGHVRRDAGVPHFLPADARVRVLSAQAGAAPADDKEQALHAHDLRWPTPPVPPRDHCAALRQSLSRR
ncbi:MAG: ChaN family lipoprotein [Pseudomonadota bacterium]|nr:ChaN family lipoprotein [Pseudomonadota bacterium]